MTNIIRTKRLEIRSFSKEDTEDLTELLLNEEIKKTYMIPDFATPEALDRMIRVFMRLSLSDDRFTKGIYLEGRLIGFVNDVEMDGDHMELGYVIHPRFWGKGYASEMLRAVIHEFLGKRFSAIRAGAFCENPASIRVMEKCGMQKSPQVEEIEYRGETHTCVYYEIRA